MKKLKIGINGLGRIGRAFLRLNVKNEMYDIVHINDIEKDIDNLAYLIKYDSVYGKLNECSVDTSEDSIIINGKAITISNHMNISEVDWAAKNIDIIVDSSGVLQNVLNSKSCIKGSVKKVVTSHAPKEGIDFTFMYGVNENKYLKNDHHVISSSICDANAVAPFYNIIANSVGIEFAQINTLHPWLSYQNLMDGTLNSVSSPGHTWKDYALGRSSIGSLIPKSTTLTTALTAVIPEANEKVHSMSFRVPTSIVSSAEGTIGLKRESSIAEIQEILIDFANKYPNVLKLDNRSLVSIDYASEEYGAIVDMRWLHLQKGKYLKFVLWYDNEIGYTSRIYNMLPRLL